MADRQIKISLLMDMDNRQALQAARQLQNTLNNLTNNALQQNDFNLTKGLQQSIDAANRLKTALAEATNANTGKLDLSKFNQSIKQSGMSIEQYAEKMQALGPEGVEAFSQITRSVVNAEMPVRKLSAGMEKLMVSFANTIRWQITTKALNSFVGSIQTAYNYAKDLNASLNDIRIVTGYSADKMADFAVQANKAAKELSATTLDYTKASLIYFQQGLDDDAVKERTDVTIKMANVTGESAQQVSDNMTAVWNNFADGSKTLEYYADVMTALGAATASSTDEISEGLEKFASIASTVGLSYEYATTALATVTATTRQSADIVGNAFKTLFARIQGLKLGETQDDGTDLNKYSEALMKVGIDIKNTNGDIKEMDAILNELGNKWTSLGKDQQIALAQTVAGVRQYTQLIALMDNWGTFQENLAIAQGSEGELQKQADIYAESWEAAGKRVQAAAEELYEKLLDDEFFIDITNAIGDLIEFISDLTDSLGGVKGLLTGIAAIVFKIKGDAIAAGLSTMTTNLKGFINPNSLVEESKGLQTSFLTEFSNLNYLAGTSVGGQRVESLQREIELTGTLVQYKEKLSIQDQKRIESDIQLLQLAEQDLLAEQEELDILQEQLETQNLSGQELEEQKARQANLLDSIRNKNKLIEEGYKKVNNYILAASENTKHWAQSFISFASNITSITFGLQSVLNIYEQLKEGNLNFSQTLSLIGSLTISLTMMARPLITSFNYLFTVLPQIIAFSKNLQAIEFVRKNISVQCVNLQGIILSLQQNGVLIEKDLLALKNLQGEEEKKEYIINKLNTLEEKKQTLEKAKQVIFSKILNPYVLTIAAIIGTIAATLIIINRHQTRFKREMEETAEAAEKAQKSFEQLNEQVKQTKSIIDSYSDSRKNIDSLTEGTQEFKQAVIEANEQALKLINTYEGLSYTINSSSGLIEINQDSLITAYNEQLKNVGVAQASSILSGTISQKAKYAYELNEDSKKLNKTIKQSSDGKIDIGADNLSTIITELAKKDTFTDDDLKAILADIYMPKSSMYSMDMATQYGQDLKDAEAKIDLVSDALKDNQEAIYEQIIAQKENTKALEARKTLAVTQLLQGNEIFQDSEFKNTLTALTKQGLTQDKIDEKRASIFEDDKLTSEEYLEARFGKDYAKNWRIDNGKLEYREGEGYGWTDQEEKIDLKDPKVIDFVAENLAFQEAAQDDKTLTKNQEQAEQLFNEIKAITSIKDTSIIDKIVSSVINGEEVDISGLGELTSQQLKQLYNIDTITTESGKIFGVALEEAVNNAIENQTRSNLKSSKDTFDQIEKEEDSSLTLGINQQSVINDFKLTEEGFEEYQKKLSKTKKEMSEFGEVSSETYEQAAAEVLDLSGDIDLLANALDEQNKKLTSGDPELYAQGLQGIQESVKNLLGTDVSLEFVEKNLENIKKAAQGDIKALNDLRDELTFEDIFGNLQAKAGTDAALVLDQFKQAFEAFDPGEIKLGASLDETGLTESLNRMIQLGLISAKEASRVLNETFGFTPEITVNEVKLRADDPTVALYKQLNYKQSGTEIGGMGETFYTFEVPSINGKATLKTRDLYGGKTSKREDSKGKKKTLDDELDRYHELTESIEDLETSYDRMGKRKDRAFGDKKLDAIDDEINALEDLIEEHKKYQEAVEENLKIDKAAVKKYGFEIDEVTGRITNYTIRFKELFNKYANSNEEEWEKIKKALDQYEETLNLFEQLKEELEDYKNELSDKRLEKITTEVEIKIDVEDKELTWLEYQLKKIERQAFSTVEQMKNILLQVQNQMDRSAPIQEGIDKIYALAEKEGRDLTQAEQDQIQEYKEQLLEVNEALMELQDTIENSLMDTIEEFNDEIDEGISRFEQYADSLDHFRNILELTGRTRAGMTTLKSIAEAMHIISGKQLNINMDKYENLLAAQAQLEQKIAEATTEEDKQFWQKQLKQVKIQTEQAFNEMLSSYEDAIKAAQEVFKVTVESTIQELKDSIGNAGLDNMIDHYKKLKEQEDFYLSDLEKSYELNKLNRDVLNSIDETDSIIAKQKLRDLTEEINILMAEGNEITQYDVDLLRAKYELELAEIALQEAQEAKSQVRMSRNSAGAWSYVFTANEENIKNAQQAYEDKLYALAKIGEDQVEALSENLLDKIAAMYDDLSKLDENSEEWNWRLNYWMEELGMEAEELQKVMTDFGINFNDTLLGQQTTAGTVGEFIQKIMDDTSNKVYDTIIPAADELTQTIDAYSRDTTQLIEENMQSISKAAGDLEEDMTDVLDNMEDSINTTIGVIQDWRDEYINTIDTMIKKNEEYYNSMQALKDMDLDFGYDEDDDEKDDTIPVGNNPNKGTPDYSLNINYEKPTKPKNLTHSQMNAQYLWPRGHMSAQQYKTEMGYYPAGYDPYYHSKSFDTGGYTGDWSGKDGKLAFLHSKELILNADDTKNFLAGITVLRAITEAIDLQAASAKLGLARIQSSTIGDNGQIIQQDVTIHAEFPNATNRYEIEEAFNNLVNRASQYVNRK